MIVSRFVDVIGQAKMPMLDLAGNYEKVGKLALERIRPELAEDGPGADAFYVENISLPPEVEQALDTRTKIGVLGNLDVHQVPDRQGDPRRGQEPRRHRRASAPASAPAWRWPSRWPGPCAARGSGGPPPLPTSGFFLGIDGKQAGPFDLATLTQKVRDGALTRATLVWKPGMANWAAADTVPELKDLFATVPPPLPR